MGVTAHQLSPWVGRHSTPALPLGWLSQRTNFSLVFVITPHQLSTRVVITQRQLSTRVRHYTTPTLNSDLLSLLTGRKRQH
ncbi:hypothetical protein R6G69_01885 [Actinotignum urinale]|uniref:hypothetical protein n=1 Tax=Actinotignum urinale TaxID=190146 RepID=UPI002A7FEAD2|nr:hypothetical protein [Actinotignum urinale]MDY5128744.1 hypothetical protein [Actinotignum urinale]